MARELGLNPKQFGSKANHKQEQWKVPLPNYIEYLHENLLLSSIAASRIKAIKIRFVRTIPATKRRSRVRVTRGERDIWQRRFWEHAIRGDLDYARHVDYAIAVPPLGGVHGTGRAAAPAWPARPVQPRHPEDVESQRGSVPNS